MAWGAELELWLSLCVQSGLRPVLHYVYPHCLVMLSAGPKSDPSSLSSAGSSLPLISVFHSLFRRVAVLFFLFLPLFKFSFPTFKLEKEETVMSMLFYLKESFMGLNFIYCISQGSPE